jgi:hypothetical protein
MDEMSLLVAETYKHFQQNYLAVPEDVAVAEEKESSEELPAAPGILYHLQRSSSVFVIRTLVSENIRESFQKVIERPEDYPSLRLTQEEGTSKLRYFVSEDLSQAEIIHDQLNNRRFPVYEEYMCNLSDPGFSWWLSKKEGLFQVSFNMAVNGAHGTVKLGPLGDQQLAGKTFLMLSQLLQDAGLEFEIQNEQSRLQFTQGESVLMEEFQDLFEFGVVGDTITNLFKFLARKVNNNTDLETMWYYLQELSHVRRFWIQVQYDLNAVYA